MTPEKRKLQGPIVLGGGQSLHLQGMIAGDCRVEDEGELLLQGTVTGV